MVDFDFDFFVNSGKLDKKQVLREIYFEIKNFLLTIQFEKLLNASYGNYLYQFENENMTDAKLTLIQTALMIALIQLNNSLPSYKRFVVSPFSINLSLENNVLKVGIITVLESDFFSKVSNNLDPFGEDTIQLFQTIKV